MSRLGWGAPNDAISSSVIERSAARPGLDRKASSPRRAFSEYRSGAASRAAPDHRCFHGLLLDHIERARKLKMTVEEVIVNAVK